MFHVHYKPLWAAIGEPDNRFRKPTAQGRMIERVMLLDAVLDDQRCTWLGPAIDKHRHFMRHLESRLETREYPHLTFGSGPEKTVRYFPDKFPIGVLPELDSHVFVFLVTHPSPMDFRLFLLRHVALFRVLFAWQTACSNASATGLDSLRRSSSARSLHAEGTGLFDLIALLLAEGTEQILRGGLLADYVEREDELVERSAADTTARLAIDAKYKLYDERKLSSSDVYQSFLYAYAYGAAGGPALPAALLVHPSSNRSSRAVRLRVRSAQALAAAEILALGLSIPDVLAELTGQIHGFATKALIEAVQQGLGVTRHAAA